jgi:hypothetical protein
MVADSARLSSSSIAVKLHVVVLSIRGRKGIPLAVFNISISFWINHSPINSLNYMQVFSVHTFVLAEGVWGYSVAHSLGMHDWGWKGVGLHFPVIA